MNSITQIKKPHLIFSILSIIGLIIYSYLILPFTNRPFITDELEHLLLCKGIIFNGVPYYHCGINFGPYPDTHPLLNTYATVLFFKLFYGADFSVRFINIFSFLCNLPLIYLIAKEIFKDNDKAFLIGGGAIFLFLINPVVIQASLLMCMPSFIPLSTLFLLLFIKFGIKKYSYKNNILLGILFAVLLWARFHTLLLLPTIFLYHIINRDFKKAIVQPLIIFSVGCCLFLITWGLHCKLFSYPFWTPFEHNFGVCLNKVSLPSNWLRDLLASLGVTRNLIFWTSPFFILLIIFSIVEAIKRYFKNKELMLIDLLILYGSIIFIIFILTSIQSAGFVLYHQPMLPTFSIVISSFIFQHLKFTKKEVMLSIGLILMCIIYCIFVVGDPLLLPFVPKSNLIDNPIKLKMLVAKEFFIILFYLILFVIAVCIIKIIKRDYNLLKAITLGTILLLISANISLDLIQKKAIYSTGYCYGERGFKEVTSYLKKSTKPNELVLTQYDIAYASNIYLFIEIGKLPFWTGGNNKSFEETISNSQIKWIIVRKSFYDQITYDPLPILKTKFKLVKSFGNFDIYRKI
ncbi:MAG: glycosyltransferase family 39 protein [bacterium]